MSQKRIILLHHVSEQGGGTKSLIDIAVMLKKDFNVTLCLPKGSSETIELAKQYQISCHEMLVPIPALNVFSGGPSYLSRNFIKGITRFGRINKVVDELMSLKPDIIIFNSLVTSIIARKIPDTVKKICFIRETIITSPFMGLIRQTFEHHIDGVAYIAEHEKDVLRVHNPIQVIIPDTLEPTSITLFAQEEAIKRTKLDKGRFYVLYMGGTAALKGFDTMLEAATYLDKNICILVIGNIRLEMFSVKNIIKHLHNPEYVRYLLRVRRFLNILANDNRVRFIGYQTNISEYMCACDLIAFPSSKPHQPRPCIEAGVYGKPVVISDFEATKEYFINGNNALTFVPHSGKDLARKISILMNDEELRERLGRNNQKMSQDKHNFKTIQNRTLCFIRTVAYGELRD